MFPMLLALVVGCAAATSEPPTGELLETDVTRAVRPGLEQRVTLTPADVTVGADVQIRSVITNRGTESVALESRICGLTLAGDIRLTWPPEYAVCGGFSTGGTIAPGESRESVELRRVESAPGVYTLRVQHALQPEHWVEMRVLVRAR